MNKYLDIFREFSPDNIIFNTLNDFVPINNGDQDTSKLPKDTASIVDEIIENFDDKNNIKHELISGLADSLKKLYGINSYYALKTGKISGFFGQMIGYKGDDKSTDHKSLTLIILRNGDKSVTKIIPSEKLISSQIDYLSEIFGTSALESNANDLSKSIAQEISDISQDVDISETKSMVESILELTQGMLGTSDTKKEKTSNTTTMVDSIFKLAQENLWTIDTDKEEASDTKREEACDTKREETSGTNREGTSNIKKEETSDTKREGTSNIKKEETFDANKEETPNITSIVDSVLKFVQANFWTSDTKKDNTSDAGVKNKLGPKTDANGAQLFPDFYALIGKICDLEPGDQNYRNSLNNVKSKLEDLKYKFSTEQREDSDSEFEKEIAPVVGAICDLFDATPGDQYYQNALNDLKSELEGIKSKILTEQSEGLDSATQPVKDNLTESTSFFPKSYLIELPKDTHLTKTYTDIFKCCPATNNAAKFRLISYLVDPIPISMTGLPTDVKNELLGYLNILKGTIDYEHFYAGHTEQIDEMLSNYFVNVSKQYIPSTEALVVIISCSESKDFRDTLVIVTVDNNSKSYIDVIQL